VLTSCDALCRWVRGSQVLAVVWSLLVGSLIATGAASSTLDPEWHDRDAQIGMGGMVRALDGDRGDLRWMGSQMEPGGVGVPSPLAPHARHIGHIDYVARGAAMRNQGYGNITVTWTGTLVAAYLVWAFMNDSAPSHGTLNGVGLLGTVHSSNPVDPCWTSSIHTLVADVTPIVVNGKNSLAGFPSGLATGEDPWGTPRVLPLLEGAALIVVYESGGPLREITLHLTASTIEGPGSLSARVVHGRAETPLARTTFVVSDGQLPRNRAIWNSVVVDQNAFPGADAKVSPLAWTNGNLWDTRTYEVPVAPGATSESATIETGPDGDCITWHAQVLRVDGGRNEPPTLRWTGEPGYEADGLDPEVGNPSTTFVYRVVYADADNDAPGEVTLLVERPLGSQYLVSTMSLAGWLGLPGEYAVGAVYAQSASLPAGTDYWYGFSAADPWDSATGPPTMGIDAPDVILDEPPVAVANASVAVSYLDAPITFDASASHDDLGIVAYGWDFGDGEGDGSPVAVHQYASRGTFPVSLTVRDASDQVGTDSLTIRVENRAPVARATATPPPIHRGQLVLLDGAQSADPDGDPLTFSWTQSGGPQAALSGADTATAAFVATELEMYVFTLTVDDGFGGTDVAPIAVNPLNRNPVANAGPDRAAEAKHVPIHLDATASSDPDGDPLTFSWTVPPGIVLSDMSDSTPVFSAAKSGTYTFTLHVEDGQGGADTDTVVVSVLNARPIATAVAPPAASKYTLVVLDGSSSSDGDGDSLLHRWAQISGPDVPLRGVDAATANFTPSVSGNYVFEMTVDDGDVGGTSSARVAVTVRNTPPAAIARAPTGGGKYESVTLDGSNSSDPDGDPLTYGWIQEGGPAATLSDTNATIATFTPFRAGTYDFRLVVIDPEGSVGEDLVAVTVTNAPPAASLAVNPPFARIGRSVAFEAAASTDPDGAIVAYAFHFGDGTQSTGTTSRSTHAYGSSGTFEVTLVVTDDEGAADVVRGNVSVSANVPPTPVAVVIPGEMGTLDTTFAFDGSGSTDDVVIVAYVWDLGDGTMATGPRAEHRYVAKGPHTIRLTVTDDEGAAATAMLFVRVANRPPVITATDPEASIVVAPGRPQRFAVDAVDPDADSLSYAWTVDGLAVAAEGSAFDFASKAGVHRLNVTVSDGDLAAWHEWIVRVQAPSPGGSVPEVNWKPLVAGVFTAILVVAGVWSARRAPWSTGVRRTVRAFAVFALPFVLGEAATGVLSFFTGWLSIPPVLGLGTAVDLAILLSGLAVGGFRGVMTRTSSKRAPGRPS